MDLVVFYSRTNVTRKVSEIIAKELDAKLVEVKDQKKRSGPIGYLMGGFDAIRSNKTNISYEQITPNEYEKVFIGTPVWASKPAPAIMEFIKENDFTNATVVTFATMGSSGGKSTVKTMNEAIKAKGGNIKRSFALTSKSTDEQSVINALNNE